MNERELEQYVNRQMGWGVAATEPTGYVVQMPDAGGTLVQLAVTEDGLAPMLAVYVERNLQTELRVFHPDKPGLSLRMVHRDDFMYIMPVVDGKSGDVAGCILGAVPEVIIAFFADKESR